jgi:hypothetical protein
MQGLFRPVVAGDRRGQPAQAGAGQVKEQREYVDRQRKGTADPKDCGNMLVLLDHHHGRPNYPGTRSL